MLRVGKFSKAAKQQQINIQKSIVFPYKQEIISFLVALKSPKYLQINVTGNVQVLSKEKYKFYSRYKWPQ